MGCRARIYVKFDREKEDWVLLKVELKHSHPCSPKKMMNYHEYRELTMHTKYVIEDNDEVDIRPNKTYLALANEVGGSSNLGFLEKKVRNYITSKLRHGLSFVSFVGVDHHGKSTLLGCALLGNENIHNFEWVFTQWVKCMGIVPQGIITRDQCKAMFSTIKKVLPHTRHRWCIWHILKKISQKLRGYAQFRELNAKLSDIVWNSRSVESFEDDWTEFIDKYNLDHNTWLSGSLL
ncbi:protein FAR1-RELATED SEQUENCE 2-like [Arachis stenosperma]|uniref:protein FAR1-RELATED SEQUENCE 2-like n=1 Tax=Arachis stenosperma TaxID=217475 RepID=UPI0025ACBBD8|nr:protein FAR1-RELATED SEQUENCE 2-like [Arachis stenosperma]